MYVYVYAAVESTPRVHVVREEAVPRMSLPTHMWTIAPTASPPRELTYITALTQLHLLWLLYLKAGCAEG
jgi:hypothetical protein